MISLGQYAEADRTRVKLAINMAQKDIVSRAKRWRWLENSASVTTVAGTQTVAAPTSLKYVARFRPVTSGVAEPDYVDWSVFDDAFTKVATVDSAVGEPEYWSVWAGTFYLYPIPDLAYQYTVYYYRTLSDLSADGDISVVPAEHHDALTYGALMLLAARDKDPQASAYWQDMYEGHIREMKSDNAFNQSSSARKVPMPRSYGSQYDAI